MFLESQPTFSTPMILYKNHKVRSMKSWKTIVEETAKWVNTNIHVTRVVSISMNLCHTTGDGQANIYYNATSDDSLEGKIKQYCEYGLQYHILDTYSTWNTQHQSTVNTINKIAFEGGRIISVCELEVNKQHNRALTVIWFMKKY